MNIEPKELAFEIAENAFQNKRQRWKTLIEHLVGVIKDLKTMIFFINYNVARFNRILS
jgi:hypothetical protein